MMDLSKERRKKEIEAAEKAVVELTQALAINKIVLQAFKDYKCTSTS